MPPRGTAKKPDASKPMQSRDQIVKKASPQTSGLKVARPSKLTEMMHIRVPDQLKRDATLTLERIGMTLPDAMRLFMRRIVVEQALPLRLDVPNTVTRAALDASMEARTSRFSTPQAMFDALEKTGEP